MNAAGDGERLPSSVGGLVDLAMESLLPRAPLYPLAMAAEGLGTLTGREPMLTRDALKMAAHHMYFSSAKAKADLGYAPRPHREALADAIAWFRAEGRLA